MKRFATMLVMLCTPASPLLAQRAEAAPEVALGELVRWHGTVLLGERDLLGRRVDGDSIAVRVDPKGGFLVADAGASQVRSYLPDGRLAWAFGRWGRGTGQFINPRVLLRLRSDRFIVCEQSGRLTTLAADGSRVITTVATGVEPLEDAAVVDDSLLLLTERARPPFRGMLHVWNLRTASETARGFEAASAFANRAAAKSDGFSRASLAGDSIFATFAPSDSVYLLGRDGSRISALALPSSQFHAVGPRWPPADGRSEGPATFDLVSGAYPLSGGRILVAYESVEAGPPPRRTPHLLLMDADGRGLAEVRNAPPLVAVKADTLYFQADADPAHLEVATVREDRR